MVTSVAARWFQSAGGRTGVAGEEPRRRCCRFFSPPGATGKAGWLLFPARRNEANAERRMKADTIALAVIRDHLDRMMYSLVDHRIALELPPNLTGFPKYESLRRITRRLDPAHETLFRLFRLGDTVAEEDFLATFPDHVVTALRATGLVTTTDHGWRTPGLLLVPAHGLLLVTGVPAAYPTAGDRPKAVFDLST